jgi:hypothetical protein
MLTGIASNRDRLFLEGGDSSKVTVDVTVTNSLSSDFFEQVESFLQNDVERFHCICAWLTTQVFGN